VALDHGSRSRPPVSSVGSVSPVKNARSSARSRKPEKPRDLPARTHLTQAGQGFQSLSGLLRAALHGLADFALPIACVCCHRLLAAHEPGIVCGLCWTKVDWLPHPRCDRCGHPSDRYRCRWCPLLPNFVRAVRSCCWVPDGIAGDLVHNLKYSGWSAIALGVVPHMARLSWPPDVVAERALLIPVPLAAERLRERGYNQSMLLATELANLWKVPVRELLARSRPTQTQTRLAPAERLRNVAGAFSVIPGRGLADGGMKELARKHVILVDDVVTTAATLNSCATALYENGARIISYVTFGRARSASDRL